MSLLNEMEVFYYVASLHSFSKAAKTLNLSKGYVSLLINSLEEQVKAKLLHRTTRHLSLTEAGVIFFKSCEKIIREKQLATTIIESVKQEPAGRLRISASPSMCAKCLSNIIPKFLTDFPKLNIEIDSTARVVDLIQEEVDVAIRITRTLDENYIAKFLTNLQISICASPAYLKKHGTPEKPEDLYQHNCLIYSADPTHYHWNFIEKSREKKIHVKGNLACNNETVIHQAVLAGKGIARLPYYAIYDDVMNGKLVVLLDQFSEPPLPTYAIYPSLHYTSPKVTKFLEYLKVELDRVLQGKQSAT